MIKCSICGFEAKNKNGLRLHMARHSKESPKVGKTEKIVFARIKLFRGEELLITYPVNNQEEIDKAILHAKDKSLKIEITDIKKAEL